MNHAKKKRGVPDVMSGTPLLSVVFYVVNKNPQNRIRSKSCKKQKKTPEIRRFQVLFWIVLMKKMRNVIQDSAVVAKKFNFPKMEIINYIVSVPRKFHAKFASILINSIMPK